MHKGTLIINHPNVPKDQEVEVFPWGMFKNGYKYEIEGLVDAEGNEVDELVLGEIDAQPPVIETPPEEDDADQSPPVKSDNTGVETDTESADTGNGGDE